MLRGPWGANMDTVDGLYTSREHWAVLAIASMCILVVMGVAVILLVWQNKVLEIANKELAGAVVRNCTAIRLGDLAWITVVNGDVICVRTAAVPTREEYVKRLPVPKVKL